MQQIYIKAGNFQAVSKKINRCCICLLEIISLEWVHSETYKLIFHGLNRESVVDFSIFFFISPNKTRLGNVSFTENMKDNVRV